LEKKSGLQVGWSGHGLLIHAKAGWDKRINKVTPQNKTAPER